MKSMKKTFLGTGIALTLLSACAPKQSQETLTKSGLNPTNYETIDPEEMGEIKQEWI